MSAGVLYAPQARGTPPAADGAAVWCIWRVLPARACDRVGAVDQARQGRPCKAVGHTAGETGSRSPSYVWASCLILLHAGWCALDTRLFGMQMSLVLAARPDSRAALPRSDTLASLLTILGIDWGRTVPGHQLTLLSLLFALHQLPLWCLLIARSGTNYSPFE